MQLDLEEVTELLGNNEMFLVLMQIRIFAVLPQWNAMPAVRLLEARKANTRDVIGCRGQEPLQRFREPVCEQLDRGGGHLFTALTFESLFQRRKGKPNESRRQGPTKSYCLFLFGKKTSGSS